MQPAGFGQIAHVDGHRVEADGAAGALTIVNGQNAGLQTLAAGKFPVVGVTFGMWRRPLPLYCHRNPIRSSWRPYVSSFISSDGSGGNGTTSPRLADRSIAMVSSRLR